MPKTDKKDQLLLVLNHDFVFEYYSNFDLDFCWLKHVEQVSKMKKYCRNC